jgi:MFS transporter, DHA2 family, methylenomycin A resistance protein
VLADTGKPSRTDPDISPPRSHAGVSPTAWRRPTLTESRRRRLTLLAMCVATFMIQLDVTIVNVALPSIQRELQASSGGLEWVISGYALSLAALIPVSGALGDRYGRRRIFLAGVVIFAVGSAACALSPDAIVLVACRVLQGAGGAAMLALTLSIITDTFPPETRAGAIGTWAAVGGTGFGVGPAVGGILLTFSGWASVFWVNLPFAAIAIAITVVAVRPTRNPRAGRLDLPGAAASAAGLFAVTLGLTESASHPWGSRTVAAPIAVGVALLVGFVGWERRCPHAMIAPALLRARSFVSASAVYLVSYTAFSGVLFYVTLLYQDVDGWSPLRTGLSWLFMNAPFLLTAQLTGRVDRRYPVARVVAAGCVAGAAGVFALSLAAATTPFVVTAVGFLLCGAGFGLLVPGVTHVAMRDVPPEISGAASGVVNASRQVGTSVGLAVLGTLGMKSAIENWTAAVQRFPAAIRAEARRQAQNVGGARINAVAHALGAPYRQPAAQSFAHGYHVAVAVAAACLLAAAVIAVLGFRPSAPSGLCGWAAAISPLCLPMPRRSALRCRQRRLSLAEAPLGVLNPPRQQGRLPGQPHRPVEHFDRARKIPGRELGLAQRDQAARDPPGVAEALAEREGVRQPPDRLGRADVLDQVIEAEVAVDLRARVEVAALLDRLGEAVGLPVVRHRRRPVAVQHLEHQAHAEQRPRGADRVPGLPPDRQGAAHQLLFSGHVGVVRGAARDQPCDAAMVAHHAKTAEGPGLGRPVAVLPGHRQHLAEHPLRVGELPGAERRLGQRVLRRPAQRCPQRCARPRAHRGNPIAAPVTRSGTTRPPQTASKAPTGRRPSRSAAPTSRRAARRTP